MKAIFLGLLAMFGAIPPLSAQSAASPGERQTSTALPSGLIVPHQEKAREIAETVYNTWRLSLLRGNEQAWRASTTKSRQVHVQNLIVSQRKRFPTDLFNETREMPKLENFAYVGALGACQGQTMAITYLGKIQLGSQGKPTMNAYILELVNEAGTWKLDQTRFFDLSRSQTTLDRLSKKDIQVLKEQDGFHPYAAKPIVPRPCSPPQLIGKVFVDCPGRIISMTINGISVHHFQDERRADVISGGLKRGENTISYQIQTEEGKPRPGMAIGLFVMPETQGNTPVCVFDHILDAHGTAAGGSFTFTIDNQHISSMNPAAKARMKESLPSPFHATPLKKKEAGKGAP